MNFDGTERNRPNAFMARQGAPQFPDRQRDNGDKPAVRQTHPVTRRVGENGYNQRAPYFMVGSGKSPGAALHYTSNHAQSAEG